MPPVAHLDENSVASISVTDYKINDPCHDVPQKQGVEFNDAELKIHEYEGVDDEEAFKVWHISEDYAVIKARNSLIVKLVKADCFKESEEHSFRGLEHKLRKGYKARQANKFDALNAVLEEQDRQTTRGMCDPELIAEAYLKASSKARETALAVGLRDAAHNSVEQQNASTDEIDEKVVDDNCSFVSELSCATIGSEDIESIPSVYSSPKKRGLFRRLRRSSS